MGQNDRHLRRDYHKVDHRPKADHSSKQVDRKESHPIKSGGLFSTDRDTAGKRAPTHREIDKHKSAELFSRPPRGDKEQNLAPARAPTWKGHQEKQQQQQKEKQLRGQQEEGARATTKVSSSDTVRTGAAPAPPAVGSRRREETGAGGSSRVVQTVSCPLVPLEPTRTSSNPNTARGAGLDRPATGNKSAKRDVERPSRKEESQPSAAAMSKKSTAAAPPPPPTTANSLNTSKLAEKRVFLARELEKVKRLEKEEEERKKRLKEEERKRALAAEKEKMEKQVQREKEKERKRGQERAERKQREAAEAVEKAKAEAAERKAKKTAEEKKEADRRSRREIEKEEREREEKEKKLAKVRAQAKAMRQAGIEKKEKEEAQRAKSRARKATSQVANPPAKTTGLTGSTINALVPVKTTSTSSRPKSRARGPEKEKQDFVRPNKDHSASSSANSGGKNKFDPPARNPTAKNDSTTSKMNPPRDREQQQTTSRRERSRSRDRRSREQRRSRERRSRERRGGSRERRRTRSRSRERRRTRSRTRSERQGASGRRGPDRDSRRRRGGGGGGPPPRKGPLYRPGMDTDAPVGGGRGGPPRDEPRGGPPRRMLSRPRPREHLKNIDDKTLTAEEARFRLRAPRSGYGEIQLPAGVVEEVVKAATATTTTGKKDAEVILKEGVAKEKEKTPAAAVISITSRKSLKRRQLELEEDAKPEKDVRGGSQKKPRAYPEPGQKRGCPKFGNDSEASDKEEAGRNDIKGNGAEKVKDKKEQEARPAVGAAAKATVWDRVGVVVTAANKDKDGAPAAVAKDDTSKRASEREPVAPAAAEKKALDKGQEAKVATTTAAPVARPIKVSVVEKPDTREVVELKNEPPPDEEADELSSSVDEPAEVGVGPVAGEQVQGVEDNVAESHLDFGDADGTVSERTPVFVDDEDLHAGDEPDFEDQHDKVPEEDSRDEALEAAQSLVQKNNPFA